MSSKSLSVDDSILVCHSDSSVQYDIPHALSVQFRFVESLGNSPFASRIEKSSNEIQVLSSCCPLSDSYKEQALNRHLAEVILRHRPSVVYIRGLYGCTCDLLRIARLLDTAVYIILGGNDFSRLQNIDDRVSNVVNIALQAASGIIFEAGVCEGDVKPFQSHFSEVPCYWGGLASNIASVNAAIGDKSGSSILSNFDYALYELMQRDHPLLYAQQKNRAIHFKGCQKVLDLGCGVGVFLDVLRSEKVPAVGVERNSDIVLYGRGMGLDIIEADALDFLSSTTNKYDGIYCSHFIEHLPFDAVKNLIHLISEKLQVGGVLVLAFPDPESIRAQLLGFWRDPEHVRFYHSHLVITLARAFGMECEWSSYDEQPHNVIPFPLEPAELRRPGGDKENVSRNGFLEKVLNYFGLASKKQLENMEKKMKHWCLQQEDFNNSIENRTDTLWSVNNTWGWNDDVTLRFRKI